MSHAISEGEIDDVPFHGPRGRRGYAVALACSALIVVLRLALEPILPGGYPFITLFIGVYIATWYGGPGPGLLTLVLGSLGIWYFLLPPPNGFTGLEQEIGLAFTVNILNNLLLIALGTAQHTSRRRAEKAARLAADRVVAVEAEAVRREAAEAALRNVREQAQRMDAVGQLAGGVAHEVNNQMTVVLGASSFLLRRSDLPGWAREELEYIREAAQRSATVTGQLLAFGRRQMLRPEALDLNAVLEDLDAILRRAVGPAIDVELDVSPERATVVADRGKVEQALLNLTFNARDAMPAGGGLRFETGRVELLPGNRLDNGAEASPGSYVVLRVRDTGSGMDPATLSRVFEPFFTTKPMGQGTGLGLSTVYGIVRQSGGYIVAESVLDAGATFTIYLPRAAVSPRPAVITGEHAHEPAAPGSRGVALVAEDEESVRRMVGRVLTEEGYDVVEAVDGGGAVEALERLRIDGTLRLVVTDLAMPVIGGRELARHVAETHPHVPVLFISGYTDDEVVRRDLLGEGQDFLPKPFSPGALARHVRQLAGHDTSAPQPAASLRQGSPAV